MSRRQFQMKQEEIIEEEPLEKEITITSLRRRLHRPTFTEDELSQFQNDFDNLDVLKTGKIKPSTILLFAEKQDNFANRNPFYYNALKSLNTEENNKDGITYKDFESAIRKVILDYNEDFNKWAEIFDIIVEGNNKKYIDENLLTETMRKIGFNVSDVEIKDIIGKMDGDLDEQKFCDIMRMIENKFKG